MAVLGIAHRPGPRLLGAEQAAIDTDRLEQQLDRVLRVQAGVEPERAHPIDVGLGVGVARGVRHEATDLVGHGAAGVGDDQLELGKVVADVGGEQARDGDRLLEDEVQAVALARGRLAAGGVDQRRHVELAERLVDRIPVAIAERRRRGPWPSLGSGLSSTPTKPSSPTARRISGIQSVGLRPRRSAADRPCRRTGPGTSRSTGGSCCWSLR